MTAALPAFGRTGAVDVTALARHLRRSGVTAADTVSLTRLSGGRSNMTYAMDVDGAQWILRTPPHGDVLATAHDMSREHRVMTALAGSRVPVPRMVLLCEDSSVLGVPFYVMERVEGRVLRSTADVLSVPPEDRRALALDLVDVLAELHRVEPAAAGLEGFGRPVGFMERQVRRWTRQLDASRTRAVQGADELAAGLARRVPADSLVAVVHGDYRLDNCVVRQRRVAAVLDWEMSTVGDPLADLALFVVYHDGLAALPNPVVEAPGRLPDVPPLHELLHRYSGQTGTDLTPLGWYLAFAWFKFAVILEGIRFRRLAGQTADEGEGVDDLVQPTVERGLQALHAVDSG